MGLTDRFGGYQAWDAKCSEEVDLLRGIQRINPGCGTCASSIKCPCCGAVYCAEEGDWVDEFNPPCDYEGYERKEL